MKRSAIAVGAALTILALGLGLAPAAWAGKSIDTANAGLDALNAGDFAHAAQLFTKALKAGDLAPAERQYAYLERGKAYLGEGKLDLAAADFKQALKLDPNDAEARSGLAQTAGAKGPPAKAAARSASLDAVRDGLEALNAGEDARAIRLFSEAIKAGDLSHDDLRAAHYRRGQAYLADKQFDLAQGDFKEALKLKPDDADAKAALALTANRQNLADVAPMTKPVWMAPPILDPPSVQDVAPLTLPGRFCSAQERNDFHAASYAPLKAASNANVAQTAAYLERLDGLIEKYRADIAYNGLKEEWGRWKAIYDRRYATAQEIGHQFDALMAVPIGC